MVSRFSNYALAILLGILCFSGASFSQNTASTDSPQGVVSSVDKGTFFCRFACTPAACASSKTLFDRCKQCPQKIIPGCLMAASGVSVVAATDAAQSGKILPPPGNCPKPAGPSGVKPLSDDSAISDNQSDSSLGSNEDSDASADAGLDLDEDAPAKGGDTTPNTSLDDTSEDLDDGDDS